MRIIMDLDSYIAQVQQLILTNIDPRRGHLTVASLGERLSRANLEASWEDFQFRSFLRFIEELQRRGLIRLLQTDKKAWAVAPTDLSSLPASVAQKSYNPLRKAVWAAFVFSSPTGRRFLHRATGAIRLGLEVSPTPIDEWVEIRPIADTEQKAWAREFADAHVSKDEHVSLALEGQDWHKSFPVALSEHSSFKLRIEWNRCRSLKVSSAVETWGLRNSVPLELLFVSPEIDSLPQPARSGSSLGCLSDQEARQCILSALANLTTEQLLAIPLPSSVLLEAAKKHFSIPRGLH